MGRIAGLLKSSIAPLGFTALTYAVGKAGGEDDQRALINAIGGVGGAYLGERLGSSLFPKAALNFKVKENPLHISLSGLGGSVAGGWAGTALASALDRSIRGDRGEGSGGVSPALLAADELALPALSIGKAFF